MELGVGEDRTGVGVVGPEFFKEMFGLGAGDFLRSGVTGEIIFLERVAAGPEGAGTLEEEEEEELVGVGIIGEFNPEFLVLEGGGYLRVVCGRKFREGVGRR